MHWIADYCMSKVESDDEIVAGPCINEEIRVRFRSDCAAKLHYKRALCRQALARGDRTGTLKDCIEDRGFAGSTVRNGGVGGR